jgi:Uma2 family endonuclease
MHANHAAPLLSLEEFERLPRDPAGWRTELVRGRVVREPPAGLEHGWLAGRIFLLIARFVEEHRLGIVVAAETGFVLADAPPTVRGPDTAFVAAHRLPVGPTGIKGFARFAPDLAVEVVSPSNTRKAIRDKVKDYLDAETRLVWVLDPDDSSITVSRADGTVEVRRAGDDLDGEDVLPGFRVPVSELFSTKA